MANKKKRTKKYKGSNAAVHTTVTAVSAVKRHPIHQWYYDRKQFRRPVLFGLLIAFAVIVIVSGLISVFVGSH